MSLASLNFLFRADTENFNRKLRESRKNIDTFSSTLNNFAKLAAGAFSVNAVVQFGKASVQAFDEAAKANAKLLTALDGNAESFRRLDAQATQLQSASLFDDESIKGAQMYLATMNLTEDQISTLLPLVMDLATKFGMDLTSAANLVAKSIGSGTNALSRYGIEVDKGASQSEKFSQVVEGLTKQVGGLSKAATEAGTSGIVQLQNAINDLQEVVGEVVSGPLMRFVSNLKDIIELRSGKTTTNFATQLERDGRQLVNNSKNLEQLRENLVNYVTELKNKLPVLGAEKKVFEDNAKAHWANGKAMREDQAVAKQIQAQYDGTQLAIENLTKLISNEAELNKLLASTKVNVTDETDKETESVKRLTNEMEKLATVTDRQGRTQAGLDAIREVVGAMQSRQGEPTKTLATNKVQVAPFADTSEEISKTNTQIETAIELTNTLAYALDGIAQRLSQGAKSWQDYGTMVREAITESIALIIKEGVAIAIKNALVAAGATGPIAIALAGIAGGLAAGLFSTAINQIAMPKLASGGLAYSPSLAVVGDNRNASIDPEVIAPLSKLQGMLGVNVKGVTRLKGRDLYVVWEAENEFKSRT